MNSDNGSFCPYCLKPITCLNCSRYWRCDLQEKSIICKNIFFSKLLFWASPKISTLDFFLFRYNSLIFFVKSASLREVNFNNWSSFTTFPVIFLVSVRKFFSSPDLRKFLLTSFKFFNISSKKSSKILLIFVSLRIFNLCEKMTCLWSFITSSNFIRVFLISKFLVSTFFWALSMALFIQGWSIDSFSFSPSFLSIPSIESPPKILINSSCKLMKKIVLPGSPCLPDLPLNWLSILLLSCLSVPTINKPPSFLTFSSFSFISVSFSFFPSKIKSLFPPSFISVPRPAMLVAIVTAPTFPASAIIFASFSCCFAFNTLCFIFLFSKWAEIFSDFSILVVPTKTGWPLLLHSIILLVIALYFSFSVL